MGKNPLHDDRVAPNGRATKENFAAWFGASKVVDSTGAPLAVYHGTSQAFERFDPARTGSNFAAGTGGFFFSDERCVAEQVADWATETDESDDPGTAPRVIEAYLSILHPLVRDFNGQRINVVKLVREALAAGHDGVIALRAQDGMPSWPANQFIVFHPQQIKSSSNCGLFAASSGELTDASAAAALRRADRAQAALQLDCPHSRLSIQGGRP